MLIFLRSALFNTNGSAIISLKKLFNFFILKSFLLLNRTTEIVYLENSELIQSKLRKIN